MWDGPAVAISSKPDLIELCLERRLAWGGHGKTYVLDLSGQIPDAVLPDGVEKVIVDPVALIEDPDDAIDLAGELFKSGIAGQSPTASGDSGDAFWETSTTGLLAGVLLAAGADGVAWARAAVGRVNPSDPEDEDQPCWANAMGRLERMGPEMEMFADEIAEAAESEEKMRDSIRMTAKSAMSPWRRSTVRGRHDERAFQPSMLEDPRATLFVVAPADGAAAGAAVAAVEAISTHWRRGQTRPEKLPYLLLAVDELCNTLPWSKLPVVVTESRAMGLALLVAVQSTQQLARRYGHDGMDELRTVFPAILCLAGTATTERDILQAAAAAHGRSERLKLTVDHLGHQSQTSELIETLHYTDLVPKDMDHGRLLRGSPATDTGPALDEAGVEVDLVDIDSLPFVA